VIAGATLRRAGPADAGLLSALKIRCWREAYAGHLPTDLLAGLDDHPWHGVAAWRAVLQGDGPDHTTEIVSLGADDVGLVRYGPYEGPLAGFGGKIDAVYLVRRAQGRGLGTALIARARAHLRAARLVPVAIEVFAFNVRALALYERLGARAIERRIAFRHEGTAVDEVLLGWPEDGAGV
jgi:GNAT superfamily N-acetyltransferase